MNQEQLEFKIGENESPADVELTENDGNVEAKLLDTEQPSEVDMTPQEAAKPAGELEQYSDKVQKRIDKLTARLRETQRREQAALDYAKQVQAHADNMHRQFQQADSSRLGETKSRIETQAVALKQIIKRAREEGDVDTETEAQERLTSILVEQQRLQEEAAYRAAQAQQVAAQQQYQQQVAAQQAMQRPVQQADYDPRAEEWAERNPWFGRDTVLTHTAWGIHRQLIQDERFDPKSDEYYDELDRRMAAAFPKQFGKAEEPTQQNNRANRPVQTVAPATRSSGINNSARRTVKLTPSQVAIAKKLNVPLEEYAKYVKE
jgi:hypothetical protein